MMFPKPKNKKHRILRNKRITEYIPCRCGKAAAEWHEPLGGKNRQLSIKYKLQVPLCKSCHMRVDKDKDFAWGLKQEMQKKFEKDHSREEFMNTFGKNYLDDGRQNDESIFSCNCGSGQ